MSESTRTSCGPPLCAPVKGVKRAVYVVLAAICVALAAIGIALPGLPTTPFLLLGGYCAARSSPPIHRYIRESPLFGPILRDWEAQRGIKRGVKIKAIGLVLIGMLVMVITLAAYPLWILAGLLLGAIGISVVLRLPTL